VYSIQHYVIKIVSNLRQIGGFPGTPVSSTNKTDHRDITEIVLNMSLKDHNAKPLDSRKWKNVAVSKQGEHTSC
jgi:hypothetical protein